MANQAESSMRRACYKADITRTQIGFLNVTAGTLVASKAATVDANKDIGTFRTISATGLNLSSQTSQSHPINMESMTLPDNCNAIRGASVNPTRTSGWISFSGTVSATPAQVYTDYRNLTTTGVAEVLGMGSFPMMATGSTCASMFGLQSICQVDSGATVLTASGAQGTGVYPIVAKTLIDSATVNSGAQLAAGWFSVQANVTDISGRASAIQHWEVASGALRDLLYVNATGGAMSTNFLNFSADVSPVLAWGADAANCAGAPDRGLRCKVGAVEYWIPMYVNT